MRFCKIDKKPFLRTPTLNILRQYDQVIPGTVENLQNTPDKCANFSPNVDINKKFRLAVTSNGLPNCGGGPVTKIFNFTWADVVGSAGTVIIDGPTSTYVGSTPTYYANGSFLTNPKNTFNWQLSLSQGSYVFGNVTSGGGNNTSVSIHWTQITCGEGSFTGPYYCYQVGIGGYAANSCSGNQSYGYTQVAITP